MKPTIWEVFSEHEFEVDGETLFWRLVGEEKFDVANFIQFPAPIVALFSLEDRLYLILRDTMVRRVDGFHGKDTDYEKISVSIRGQLEAH